MHQIAFITILCGSLAVAETKADSESDLWTGSDAHLGGIFFPHLHAFGVIGDTSGDPMDLALNGHDPSRSGFNLLALEPAFSMRLGDHLEGFVVNSYLTDGDGHFTGGNEEAFLKLVNLPGSFEVRGGRYFNRFGFQNARHNHSWDYVDQHLANSRLLQEGELTSIGGELTWNLPTRFPAALSVSLGAPPSGHGHGHEEEEAEEDHEHGLEAELANFDDYIATANLVGQWRLNDFHQWMGSTSVAIGENGFGEDTQLYGLGLEYLWRENGLQAGGSYFRWRTEALLRLIDTATGDHDEFGIYSSVSYGLSAQLEASLRVGYVSSLDDFELDERWRLSPTLTWSLNADRTVYTRLQYNYDHSSDFGDAHGIWLGLGFNFGGPEVR